MRGAGAAAGSRGPTFPTPPKSCRRQFGRVCAKRRTGACPPRPPRINGGSFKAWALAARVVFAISPNSASCERVFALLKRLFGEQQMSSLADLLQASLMLNYNKRTVG